MGLFVKVKTKYTQRIMTGRDKLSLKYLHNHTGMTNVWSLLVLEIIRNDAWECKQEMYKWLKNVLEIKLPYGLLLKCQRQSSGSYHFCLMSFCLLDIAINATNN